MRHREQLAFALLVALVGLTLAAWAWALSTSEFRPPQLHKNAYYPYSVETSIKDK